MIHAGGGFVANTLRPAAVVEGFSVAAGVLSNMGGGLSAATGATSLATAPLALGAVALTVCAVGGYCYFHGIPVPIESTLSSAGLGMASKQGFMVSIPQLAVALIVLGGAGYVAYRFYKNFKSVRAARLFNTVPEVQSKSEAEVTARAVFGDEVWIQFGQALWSSVGDAGRAATATAQDAVNASAALAQRLVSAATGVAAYAKEAFEAAQNKASGLVGSAGASGYAAYEGATEMGTTMGRRASGFFGSLRRLVWRRT